MPPRALVGRDRELAVLDEIVASGDREIVLLTGEPGIGKSRLLEELARRVVAAGGACAWGRMLEVGLTPAFWPWIQILGALETGDDRAPAFGDTSSGDVPSGAGRLARYGEVVAFLVRRAAERPIALVFDDLHVADPSSLQLLEYVVPLLAGKRVVIAIAARDHDATPDVAAAIGRLQRGARRVPLARLRRDEVTALVGDRADGDRVFELSEGNPLFVEELVAAGGDRLPHLSSVRGVIRERVARLPGPTRELVVAAAILGRDFRGQLVGDMLATDIAARIKPLLDLGMVAMTAPDRYRFSHALIAEALADELDPSERARLHLRAANALEHRGGDPSALAHHLLAAGHLAAAAAVEAAERAAKTAMAQLAFEDAAVLLERATHALALAAPNDKRHLAELLCARAEAHQQATQPALALALCEQSAALARELGDGELLARIAIVRGLEFRFGRTDPLLVGALEEALAAIGDRGPVRLRALLLARLAAAEQPAEDPQGPVALAWQAIALAKQLELRDRLDVMYIATAALIEYVPSEELEPVLDEVLELARGFDRWIAIHTRLRMCFAALERADRTQFEDRVLAFAAEATALGQPRWLHHVEMLGALSATLDGKFDEAARAADRAAAIATAMNDANALWLLDVHLAITAAVRTAPVDEKRRARLETYPRGRAALQAWFAEQTGERDRMRSALAELVRMPPHDDMLLFTCNAIVADGDADRAAVAYDAMSRRQGTAIVSGMVGCTVVDIADRALVMLAMVAGRWDAIDRHAEAALAIAAGFGGPVWTAKVQADLADALDARARRAGRADAAADRARAAELRAAAAATAARLDMPGLAARLRSSVAVGSATAPPVANGRVALARAGELWTITGFGEQIHVKDSRGMQMLARLVEAAGRELHALEVVGSDESVDGGNAGPALDATARAQYRDRMRDLMAERDEAEAFGDAGRAERASDEIEALTAELERAFGLGGRERKVGAASERARSNAQRRIAHALEQIRAASPRIGEHLVAAVKTGTYCSYAPR